MLQRRDIHQVTAQQNAAMLFQPLARILKDKMVKKLYMNEDTLEKIESFYRVKHDLQSLYRVLLRC